MGIPISVSFLSTTGAAMFVFTWIGVFVVGYIAAELSWSIVDALCYAIGATFIRLTPGFVDGTRLSKKIWTVCKIFGRNLRYRYFGAGAGVTEISGDGWVFTPPFRLRRRH